MSRKKVVLVPEHIDENGIRVLEQSTLAETVYFDDRPVSQEVFNQALREASAIMVRITRLTRDMIHMASRLEVIAKHGVGVDNIDVGAANDRKIPVTITSEANSDAVAEHTMAMMLALARNLSMADTDLKKGQFTRREHYTGVELGGKVIGIIGLGRIGSRVARKSSLGFGMKVMAIDPFISADYAIGLGVELVDDLEHLLKSSDYVSIHAPLTPLTENMIDEKELRKMKEDAVLLNTARGGIVNEEALYKALSEHWIKAAALDVFSKEPPLPGENPLLGLDNVMVTPHIAGGTKEAGYKMATVAAEEIVRVLSGKRPKDVVNTEIYDY